MKVILSHTRFKYRNRFKPDVVDFCKPGARTFRPKQRSVNRKCNPGKLEPGTVRELNEMRKPCRR